MVLLTITPMASLRMTAEAYAPNSRITSPVRSFG
jgi:hypothetical protein